VLDAVFSKEVFCLFELGIHYMLLAMSLSSCVFRYNHVEKANSLQAIETLLISDELFRYVQHSLLCCCILQCYRVPVGRVGRVLTCVYVHNWVS